MLAEKHRWKHSGNNHPHALLPVGLEGVVVHNGLVVQLLAWVRHKGDIHNLHIALVNVAFQQNGKWLFAVVVVPGDDGWV